MLLLCDDAVSAALGAVRISAAVNEDAPLGRRKQRAEKVQRMLQIFHRLTLPLENNQLVPRRVCPLAGAKGSALSAGVNVQAPSFEKVYRAS